MIYATGIVQRLIFLVEIWLSSRLPWAMLRNAPLQLESFPWGEGWGRQLRRRRRGENELREGSLAEKKMIETAVCYLQSPKSIRFSISCFILPSQRHQASLTDVNELSQWCMEPCRMIWMDRANLLVISELLEAFLQLHQAFLLTFQSTFDGK